MWSCLCGSAHRNRVCSRCGRTISDIAPFTNRLDLIYLGLRIVADTGADVITLKAIALDELASNATLSQIASRLERVDESSSLQMAKILRNLDG